MKQQGTIKIFEDKKIRTLWVAEQDKWYISVIDVIEVLTNSDRPRKYWSDLKAKLKKEGSKKVARQGGNVAKVAKKELEAKTGKKVVTALNTQSIAPKALKK